MTNITSDLSANQRCDLPSLRGTSVIFAQSVVTGILRGLDLKEKCPDMRFLSDILSCLPPYGWVALIVSALGIAAVHASFGNWRGEGKIC